MTQQRPKDIPSSATSSWPCVARTSTREPIKTIANGERTCMGRKVWSRRNRTSEHTRERAHSYGDYGDGRVSGWQQTIAFADDTNALGCVLGNQQIARFR